MNNRYGKPSMQKTRKPLVLLALFAAIFLIARLTELKVSADDNVGKTHMAAPASDKAANGAVTATVDANHPLPPGAKRCLECHEKQVGEFTGQFHVKAWKTSPGVELTCENCHGNGDKHIESTDIKDIISFTKASTNTPEQKNKQCLTCHSTYAKVAFWKTGEHARNDVSCVSCHKVHHGNEMIKPSTATCFTCHKEIKTAVSKFSHHPINEGKVTCWDCHNPHGSMNDKALKTDSVNQTCFRCHADKRGPYAFEHPPVVENCLNCHNPHGTSHEKLLKEPVPLLCQSCHDQINSNPYNPADGSNRFHGSGAAARFMGRGCMNCHNHIHGSNTIGTRGMHFGQ